MNAATRPALADLAYCFLPSDPRRHGVVVEPGHRWSFDPSVVGPGVDVVVYVCPADRSPMPEAARHAAARRRARLTLSRRLPPGWRVAGIHHLPLRQVRTGGVRARMAAAVRSGALVEVVSGPAGDRVLDAVAASAGAAAVPRQVHLAAGGSLLAFVTLADGTEAVLRAGRSGTTADPGSLAPTLRSLAAAGVTGVPRLLGQGTVAGAAWLVESRLPGRRPRRLTAALAGQVAEVCGSFPPAAGPAEALAEDLAGIAGRLPDRAAALAGLVEHLETRARAWPGVLRHGDLWLGNLLVEAGRLSGVLDWDGAHPAAVPGADLVHLFATEALIRRGVAFGAAFLDRPWDSPEFRRLTGPYWRALGLAPDPELLDLGGIAWWAGAVHGTLARLPARAADRSWLSANVDPVVGVLGGLAHPTA